MRTPMDVLWFRVSRRPDDGEQTLGRIIRGKMMVMLNRDDYWQCAYLVLVSDVSRLLYSLPGTLAVIAGG